MIHIYYMNVCDCSYEQSLAFYGILTEERRAKADSTTKEEIAKMRLLTGAFLQYVISKETGIPVNQLVYRYGEQGKPELDYDRIRTGYNLDKEFYSNRKCFNLSHSGGYVVVAVSDRPVGIDIEHKTKNGLAVAKRCFCKEEYEDILAAGNEKEQEQRFLEYWTMKEAYIKRSGEGMRIPLNSFCLEKINDGLFSVEGHIWLKTMQPIAKGYQISICSTEQTDIEEVFNNMYEINLQQLKKGLL